MPIREQHSRWNASISRFIKRKQIDRNTENNFNKLYLIIFETRMWFLRPSRDISLLQQRQKAVSYFMNLRNSELVASLQDCLKHIKNVSVSMDVKVLRTAT